MFKTHNPFLKMRVLLLCLLSWLLPQLVWSQTTCGSATNISDTYSNHSLSASDTAIWYKFTATRTDGEIQLLTSSTGYRQMWLYSGTCTGLVLRDTSRKEHYGEAIDYSGLTISNTYYLKITKAGTGSVSYGLAFINSIFSLTCTTCYNSGCEYVCNNSFENRSADPNNWSQINNVYCWGNVGGGVYAGSADQFHANGTVTDVPTNPAGTEGAHTGSGYAGIIAHQASTYTPACPTYREYVVGKTAMTLTAGWQYRVSFWVSLAENSGYAVGNLGAYISSTVPSQSCWNALPVTPQILQTSIISQDAGWVQISGTFIATGGEQYITIGAYSNLPVQAHTPADGTSQFNDFAYYYIDDVSIVAEPIITVAASPAGACLNMPVTLSITTTSGGINTSTWTPSQGTMPCVNPPNCTQATFSNAYSSSTTYTITSTVFTGCTITNTFVFSPATNPLTVNAGTNQNICLGGSATLLGSGTGTYNSSSWAILNGSTLCSGCSTTVVSPTTTTQYVYTITNTTTGCSRKDTMTVTVTPLTVNIVAPSGATTCAGCFNFTTATGYSTYSWSTNAVSSSGGSTSTLNACWGSPFDTTGINGNVSVSVVDGSGCQGSAYLIVPSCCPFKDGQELSFPNLVNDSTTRVDATTYPSLFWYNTSNQYYETGLKEFSINGVFIVDKNTRFKGCHIKLGPNAKIIVRPGIKLEFTDTASTNSKLHACSDLWDGIYVDGTNSASKVTVTNGTVIEDAKNALVSTNGGDFLIDGGTGTCKFNKNNIGVLVKTYSGTHPGIIAKTIFACDAPGQQGATTGITFAGANCRAPVSGKGLAGVYIENCNSFIVGDSSSSTKRNLFERTQYGVYSTGSNVKVWNNDFKYFTTTILTKNVPPNGIAVYLVAGKFTPKTCTVGRQGGYKAKNKFTKCSYGTYAYNYINLNCEYNRFDSCMTAGITTMNCQNRTILINQDTLTECTGTNIQCVQSTSSSITITNNLINNTGNFALSNFGHTGIYVVQSAITPVTLKIQNNKVRKMRNGIWVSRVDGAKITDNDSISFMTGQPMSQLNPCIGIKLEELTNSMVRENTVTWATTPTSAYHDEVFGIHMTNCKNDTVCKNILTKMGSGIFLKGACNPSILACNAMTTCFYGVNFNYLNGYGAGVSINDQITWTTALTPYSTGNTWTTTASEDITGRILPVSAAGIKWYYTSSSPDVSSVFPGSLLGNAATYTGNGDQCSQMLAPPAQDDLGIRNYTLSGICKTPRTYDTLNAQYVYHDKVYAYRMLRQHPSWRTGGSKENNYYLNFYNTESSTNIGKFADVEDSISAGSVANAITLLASITASGEFEVNRKAVLNIYLQTWAIDSMNLDSTQEATLMAIVNQGTLVGGTAVFDARNMLHLEVHDSSAVRLQQPSTTYIAPVVSHVYPNPSNGSVSINMELNEGQSGTFDVVDLTGRLVGSWQFVGGQGVYTFDASYLPSGTYIYCVRTQGEMLKSDRMVIVRE